jgi:hypothetical protein
MRIKSQLRFNTNNKSPKEQNQLIQIHLIDPILKEAKKLIKKKVKQMSNSNNKIIDFDLIVIDQRELISVLKAYNGEIANEIYLLLTKEKQIPLVEI